MRLDLHKHRVSRIELGSVTEYTDGLLRINSAELTELILQDQRLSEVQIELAQPGESCRILQISDVIQPRARLGNQAKDFPGALGDMEVVGQGSTAVLDNAAVMIADQTSVTGPSHDPMGAIVDMSGPGSELTPYAHTHNVVILPQKAEGVSRDEYLLAQKLAGLRSAVYLARTASDSTPGEVKVYDLPPYPDMPDEIKSLPRVVYGFQVYCTSFPPVPGEPILYGDSLRRLVPTVVHPNEVLDGALINPYQGLGIETYAIQNSAVIEALYERHGKDLCFMGVVIMVSQYTEPERIRSARVAAHLARDLLGADTMVLTKSSSGAPDIDLAQTAHSFEALEGKSAMIMWGSKQDAGDEKGSVIFNIPGAEAMVSTGSPLRGVDLPEMQRVIGHPATRLDGGPVEGAFRKRLLFIAGAVGQLGGSDFRAVTY